MNNKKWILVGFFLCAPLVISACDPVAEVKSVLYRFFPSLKPAATETSESAEGEAKPANPAEMARANLELLSEMMKVTFNVTEVDDKINFGELAHTLNQGASLEGIYRGIVVGSKYRGLEGKSQAASPAALKAFAVEMAEIQDTMKEPTQFSKEDAKGVTIEYPEGVSGNEPAAAAPAPTTASVIPAAGSQEVRQPIDKKEAAGNFLHIFIGSSPFTLKRILADEAMKKMEELKDAPGELAQWYAQFTLQMVATGIDFGLKQRNEADFDFHFRFAQTLSQDHVKWEVVNRCHRFMNAAIAGEIKY